MRLFRRGRTSWAAATVLSVHNTERLDQHCEVEVHPQLASPFRSELRTHRHITEAAETFVLYDPAHPGECELDMERLRAWGVDDERAYTYVAGPTTLAARGHVTLADAAQRLAALDHLAEQHRAGEMSATAFEAERRRILTR